MVGKSKKTNENQRGKKESEVVGDEGRGDGGRGGGKYQVTNQLYGKIATPSSSL